MCCLSSIRQTPPGQLPEHNCFEPVVAWIRACEADEGVQKVVALALVFFVSLILCVSVVGLPFFLMAHEEYVLQEVELRFASEREAAMRQLTATNEDQARQITWLNGQLRPDSDEGNIIPFAQLPEIAVTDISRSETTPRVQGQDTHGAVQTPKAPLPPDQQIAYLTTQIAVLKRENATLVIQNSVLMSARGTLHVAGTKTLPLRPRLSTDTVPVA